MEKELGFTGCGKTQQFSELSLWDGVFLIVFDRFRAF
jgi:hypothetical protein